jgi:Flp pilus assembly protein TadG
MVEFAFGSVFLMIILAGLLDLSRAFHYTIGLEGAARAGARHGAFYVATSQQQAYLDDTDIKSIVDKVLAGDGLNPSTLKSSAACLVPTDSNTWVNPPYASAAYPSSNNSPWLYICYDTKGANKAGTKAAAPAANDATYTSSDLAVILLDRYGLFGGLSNEYLKSGASLTSIQLTAYQHFAVQG